MDWQTEIDPHMHADMIWHNYLSDEEERIDYSIDSYPDGNIYPILIE